MTYELPNNYDNVQLSKDYDLLWGQSRINSQYEFDKQVDKIRNCVKDIPKYYREQGNLKKLNVLGMGWTIRSRCKEILNEGLEQLLEQKQHFKPKTTPTQLFQPWRKSL